MVTQITIRDNQSLRILYSRFLIFRKRANY